MILHFSHIGLTDGRTFTFSALSSIATVPTAWLWRPFRPPLPGCSTASQRARMALQAQRAILAGAAWRAAGGFGPAFGRRPWGRFRRASMLRRLPYVTGRFLMEGELPTLCV